jgi:AraC-like DNA-binding protein
MSLDSTPHFPPPPECRLLGLWRFCAPGDHRIRCRSTPGHLPHLLLAGRYRPQLAGQELRPQAGDCIWYHEEEAVHWAGDGSSVAFLSCQFSAPAIRPPALSARCWAASSQAQRLFSELWTASRQVRDRAGSLDLQALTQHLVAETLRSHPAVEEDPWDRHEAWLLGHDALHWDLPRIANALGCSAATLDRLCRARHGCGPGHRLRHLRLEQAAALLQQSPASIEGLARQLHFRDGSALARAFRQHFGHRPGVLRRG